MGRHCPYCPTVLKELDTLYQGGILSELETIVIEDHPEIAVELGVRSVPWVRIGAFELPGLRSGQEFREWAERAGSPRGTAGYLDELLSSGEIDKVLKRARTDPGTLQALLLLFTDRDTALNTQIGIGAVMESLEGSDELHGIVHELCELTRHEEPRVRGDACYYLALSGDREAIEWITPLLRDPDENVRGIASDSLEKLAEDS